MNPSYRVITDGSNILAHHGIRGQKWGIRRYQNPDGTLTAEGKKRYGKAREILLTKGAILTPSDVWPKAHDATTLKRANKAADLGMDALIKMERWGMDDLNDKNRDSFRDWFIYEDQTMGLPSIADLVIQGKSKSEIEDIINEAEKIYLSDEYDYTDPKYAPVFYLAECYNPSALIDACLEVKEDQDKKK